MTGTSEQLVAGTGPFTGEGTVDFFDYLDLVAAFEHACPPRRHADRTVIVLDSSSRGAPRRCLDKHEIVKELRRAIDIEVSSARRAQASG